MSRHNIQYAYITQTPAFLSSQSYSPRNPIYLLPIRRLTP
nr:MAG TPA: hypothetical protein [Caudoviricetes sp.]